MIIKIWKDPVWSKVIAVSIIALLGVLFTYFQIDSYIKSNFPAFSKYFFDSTLIPNWLLVALISVLFLLTVYYIKESISKTSIRKYKLTKTNGGAVVYQFDGEPQHFACPSCLKKGDIEILQDNRTISGKYRCVGCSAEFPINPRS